MAFLALVVLSPLLHLVAILIKLTSGGPVIFVQQREGLKGTLFPIFKFRTMVHAEAPSGPTRTRDRDPRITPLGRYLRKWKLDELPQLYNVFRGEMSFVGPRPKLPQHTEIANMPYRPGVTGRATLEFRQEEKLLGSIEADRLDMFYKTRIGPLKERLDRCYMCNASFLSDARIVISSAFSIIAPRPLPPLAGSTRGEGRTSCRAIERVNSRPIPSSHSRLL
jgi:lipopolysaccharide/colanic/teichoic acid biosynthesis glycosyltransferase